jgi:Rrf2 family protein
MMSANSRMTVGIHILSFMVLWEQRHSEHATSERIATSVNTNPVVIRRLLGLLKSAGLVESKRGVSAGWRLAKRPEVITLRDIYHAVENAPLFGPHAVPPNRNCPIGRGVQPALKKIYGTLEEQLRGRLSKITLAQVFADTMR